MEMGFNYPVGAVVDDGSPRPWRDPMGSEYRPTTRPGCRLPHTRLEYQGVRCSTHELIPMGGMLALTSDEPLAQEWVDAVAKVSADTGVPVRTVRIGPRGDAFDPSQNWIDLREVGPEGIILVRPDGHVGFRADKLPRSPADTIAAAIRHILLADNIDEDQ
jgi:2,4-dichlorophenol 6-monooxygenase